MSSGVEFEEDKYGSINRQKQMGGIPGSTTTLTPGGPSIPNDAPKMIQWLMRHGLAKTPATGTYILAVVIVINIIITYVLLTRFL